MKTVAAPSSSLARIAMAAWLLLAALLAGALAGYAFPIECLGKSYFNAMAALLGIAGGLLAGVPVLVITSQLQTIVANTSQARASDEARDEA